MLGDLVADMLVFPEGPVWHAGSLYFVEIGAGRIARFTPGQDVQRIAHTGGGPNGATLGPGETAACAARLEPPPASCVSRPPAK